MPREPAAQATRWSIACGAVVLAAIALRVLAARGDLWLDEVWSLDLASRLASPLDAYGLKHDNNHILNTMWLVLLGVSRPDWAYRLPSELAGAAAVVVSGALVPRKNLAGRLATLLLVGSSTLLVTYSSEARGYMLAVCASLLSLLALEWLFAGGRLRWVAPLFWVSTVLGFVAHLSAATAWIAIALYWLARRAPRSDRSTLLREAVSLHLVPALALAAHYLVFVRQLGIGGGEEATSAQAIAAAAALTLGLPAEPAALAVTALLVVVGLFALALFTLARERDASWVLFGAGVTLPVIALYAMRIQHAAPRYLLISVVFFLLLLGRVAGRWIERGGLARGACVALLLCVVALNSLGDLELIRLGRGSYRRAVDFIVAHSEPGPITISSDHDFRNLMLLAHYAPMHEARARLSYLTARDLPPEGTQWLIVHRIAGQSDAPPDQVLRRGQPYEMRLALPCGRVSGMSWYLYQRVQMENSPRR